MASNMLKLKTDPNLVAFRFDAVSMLNGRVMIAICVIVW